MNSMHAIYMYMSVSIKKEREVKEKRRELEQQIMGVDSSCSIEDGNLQAYG